jgi:protein TonB
MPTFQGGDINKFRDYLQSRIFIPPIANIEGICGKVIVSFVIDEQGNICNIEILKSPYKDFDQEVKRLLSNSPNWEPGLMEGNQVKVAITMPIIFLIEY